MINPEMFCLGCMAPKDYDGPCKLCGFRNGEPVNADYLTPGTTISERYLIGKLLAVNGESAEYIAYDQQEEMKVFVRELMPRKLATRNHSNMHIKPLKESESVYKGFLLEFDDICSRLRTLSSVRSMIPLIDIQHENNTIYAVYRYIALMPLSELIAQCGGEIKWGKCKKLFLGLLNTLSQVHKKGLIHAGISPQTILIDEKGNPYLSGFSLNATRSFDSEIDSELHDGYSAPEQYENKRCYGEWTDIYGICAVMYRTITGTMPPGAQDRKLSDNLLDAIEMDSTILQNVSDAIHNGMMLSVEYRTHNADVLSMQLLDNIDSNTAIFSVEPCEVLPKHVLQADQEFEPIDLDTKGEDPLVSAQATGKLEMQKQAGKRRRIPQLIVSVFIPMLLTTALLGGVIWYFIRYQLNGFMQSSSVSSAYSDSESSSDQSAESEESSSSGQDMGTVPDFVGKYIDHITADASNALHYEISTKYDYNDAYANGVVFDQSPKPGASIKNKGVVILSVSKGRDSINMPNLEGSSLELAIKTLTDLELRYEIVTVVNDEYIANMVKYTEPPADTPIKKSDKELTIYLFTKKITETSSSESSDASKSSSSSESASSKYKTSKPSEPEKPKAKKKESSSTKSQSD